MKRFMRLMNELFHEIPKGLRETVPARWTAVLCNGPTVFHSTFLYFVYDLLHYIELIFVHFHIT